MCGDVGWIGGLETDGNYGVRQNDCVNGQEKGAVEIKFRKKYVCVLDRQDL